MRSDYRSPLRNAMCAATPSCLGSALMCLAFLAAAGEIAPSVPVVTATKGSDLVVQRIEFMDCVPRVGVAIYNQGPASVASAFDVRLTTLAAGSTPVRETSQTIGGLGGFSTARLIFDLPPRDAYVAFVDAKGAVKEANESNNELRVPVRSLGRCPSVSVGNGSAAEGEPLRFPVRISHAFSQPVRVSFTTEEGTALSAQFGLAAGVGPTACAADFIRATGTLEFPAGTAQLTQVVSVSSCVDNVAEDAETFALRITAVVNGTAAVDASVGVGTIEDAAP